MASAPMPPSLIVGSAAESVLQGDGVAGTPLAWRGLRMDTITGLRWVGVAGQSLTLAVVGLLLGFRAPFLACGVLIGFSAAVNLGVVLSGRRGRFASSNEAAVQLSFDVLQLAGVLYLTGGVANPFALLMIAPVTLAAANLPWRQAAVLAGVAIACAVVLAFWFLPLPWAAGQAFAPPLIYRLGAATAVVAGVVFTAAYAFLAARQAARMELALHTTQAVLAREQRLSALGAWPRRPPTSSAPRSPPSRWWPRSSRAKGPTRT